MMIMDHMRLLVMASLMLLIQGAHSHASVCQTLTTVHTSDEEMHNIVRTKVEMRGICGRDYDKLITDPEKKCIRRIINKLARDSLVNILSSKYDLERDGDRIDHIHPFRFLEYTLNHEELKVGMLAIRERGGWLWDGFISGITRTLAEEARQNNLATYVAEFARVIKIDIKIISQSLQEGKWKDFVNILLDNLPRKNNPNRYDM